MAEYDDVDGKVDQDKANFLLVVSAVVQIAMVFNEFDFPFKEIWRFFHKHAFVGGS